MRGVIPGVLAAACLMVCLAAPARAGYDLWVNPAGVPPISFQTLPSSSYTCAVNESCLAVGSRRVMRFGNAIVNIGNADLNVGTPPPPGVSDSLFHWDTCHEHHHLVQIMRYELLNANGTVAVGRKQNFCMADSKKYFANAPPSSHTCTTVQGITRGWQDIYSSGLDCQWLDITGLPDGIYTLRLTVDPLNKYAEDNENNNVTTRAVVLEQSVGVGSIPNDDRPNLQLVGVRPGWGAEAVAFTTGSFAGHVTLSVYDVEGAERRTLLDQEEAADASEYVPWHGLDQSGRLLPSGVYYVRLHLGETSITRPVLIIDGAR